MSRYNKANYVLKDHVTGEEESLGYITAAEAIDKALAKSGLKESYYSRHTVLEDGRTVWIDFGSHRWFLYKKDTEVDTK